MSNMSYVRFENTCDALSDCYDIMTGVDDHYQKLNDLSRSEYLAMRRLIHICKDIIELVDNKECVLLEEDYDPRWDFEAMP